MEIRNRRINPRKKQRPEAIDELETYISSQKEAIERGNAIVQHLKGNPGWEALCLNYKEELDELELKLDQFEEYEGRVRPSMLKRRADLREFLGKIESIERTVEALQEDMNESIADLNERKKRARATVPA